MTVTGHLPRAADRSRQVAGAPSRHGKNALSSENPDARPDVTLGFDAVRQPRVGELIADALRRRILSGEFPDGMPLPTQPVLKEAFGVSMPSVREALRMLEAEGLVVMRRGAAPGAMVRLPSAENVAYMLGLTLSAQATSVGELGEAIERLEPVCAALCAERPDRHQEVVPVLRQLQRDAVAGQADQVAFSRHARRFHEGIVAHCGNRAISLMLGSFELLWAPHLRAGVQELQSARPTVNSSFTPEKSIVEHQALLEAIADGDPERAESLSRHHVKAVFCDALPLATGTRDGSGVIRPDLLKATGAAAGHGSPGGQAAPAR